MQKIDLANGQKIESKITTATLEKRLRQKRSTEYLQALRALDIGGHNMDESKFDEFVQAVNKEFPDIELEKLLVGIVAKCYLGAPYDVHTLDMLGQIVTHYKCSEPMPILLEKARGMALYGGYEFIEVYTDSLKAVSRDGSVAVVK